MRNRLPALAAGAALAFGAAGLVQAQTAEAPAATQQAPAAANITDEQVNSFALAMNEVSSLNQKFSAELQAAPDDATRTQIQQQAATEMTQAVEKSGITPTEYNQIAQAAQADAELRARIGQAMQDNGVAPPN
ncbi:DUF4168 domain-containing protein [Phenylobacterium sp.]|uniref:DUF4168 domain-containing protein n=1 Tax=Phenylobacterium sp. TaxID=1871053 RepID=UPI00272F9F26|nr:DUF4168 domain-containing protein [Phenylobacterium sp.]MDP1618774.1 DUF4168 domain-containing protein [Phenylobacterium sp.]MDP1988553.1 DUF4168 domain-containing protein [Phenylobacterium sp.]